MKEHHPSYRFVKFVWIELGVDILWQFYESAYRIQQLVNRGFSIRGIDWPVSINVASSAHPEAICMNILQQFINHWRGGRLVVGWYTFATYSLPVLI